VSGENKIYDCIIIGAGPSGVQAALYLIRANKSVVVFHSYELGALKYTHMHCSFIPPKSNSPKYIYRGFNSALLHVKNLVAKLKLSLPLSLIIEIPPTPIGVEIAHIVSIFSPFYRYKLYHNVLS